MMSYKHQDRVKREDEEKKKVKRVRFSVGKARAKDRDALDFVTPP